MTLMVDFSFLITLWLKLCISISHAWRISTSHKCLKIYQNSSLNFFKPKMTFVTVIMLVESQKWQLSLISNNSPLGQNLERVLRFSFFSKSTNFNHWCSWIFSMESLLRCIAIILAAILDLEISIFDIVLWKYMNMDTWNAVLCIYSKVQNSSCPCWPSWKANGQNIW